MASTSSTIPHQPVVVRPPNLPVHKTGISGDSYFKTSSNVAFSQGHIQEIDYELQQAKATTLDYNVYPTLGQAPDNKVNYPWAPVNFTEVGTFKGRNNWVKDALERIPQVTHQVFNQARDFLCEIMYRNGTVHGMTEKSHSQLSERGPMQQSRYSRPYRIRQQF